MAEEKKPADNGRQGRVLLIKRDDKILSLLYSGNRLLRADACRADAEVLDHIYIGKVKNVKTNINAAFVEFTPGKLCFLSLKDCKTPIVTNRRYDGRILAGDEIVVQIVSESQKTKEAGASTNLSFAGKYFVLTTGRLQIGYSSRLTQKEKDRLKAWLQAAPAFSRIGTSYGLVFRTNCREPADFSSLESELQRLLEEADTLLSKAHFRTCFSLLRKTPPAYLKSLQDYDAACYEKILTDERLIWEEVKEWLTAYQPADLQKLVFYEDHLLSLRSLYSVEARLQEALERKVWLKSGGYLVIDRTEALTCIDVNSGKYTGNKSREESFFQINMEAAQEIGHQLLLRNLSGIIIIDFINMKEKSRNHALMDALRDVLADDPMRASVVDMTALGLVEVTRKKEKKPLWEQLQ